MERGIAIARLTQGIKLYFLQQGFVALGLIPQANCDNITFGMMKNTVCCGAEQERETVTPVGADDNQVDVLLVCDSDNFLSGYPPNQPEVAWTHPQLNTYLLQLEFFRFQ
jgi:hypothetical protein